MWPEGRRPEPRLIGPFVLKWFDVYANTTENGLHVARHVPLSGDCHANARKMAGEVPVVPATAISCERFPTFAYFYNSTQWERARFMMIKVRCRCT